MGQSDQDWTKKKKLGSLTKEPKGVCLGRGDLATTKEHVILKKTPKKNKGGEQKGGEGKPFMD